MDSPFSQQPVHEELERLLDILEPDTAFETRAVLVIERGHYRLLSCVVRPRADYMSPIIDQGYGNTVLVAQLMNMRELKRFLNDLSVDRASIGNYAISRTGPPQWELRRYPAKSVYMEEGGWVAVRRLPEDVNLGQQPLVGPGKPYYANDADAVGDWSGLRVFHGDNDGSLRKLHVLIPERRAYLDMASWSSDGQRLTVGVAGSELERGRYLVQGACWNGKEKKQLSGDVKNGQVTLEIAAGATRLELVLLSEHGTIYDRHIEHHLPGYPADRSFLANRTRSGPGEHGLEQALQEGEGRTIEFKPFIDITRPNGDTNAKFHQVVRTVVAFANTAGGYIYIGVDNNCSVIGVDEPVRAWGKSALDDCLKRYCLELRTKIKDSVVGQVDLEVNQAMYEARPIIFVRVGQTQHGPVAAQSEPHFFFLRVGGSSKRLLPAEWLQATPRQYMAGPPEKR